MRLRATLLNKVIHQRQIARLLSNFVQTHQRQFDLRMPWVAVQLSFTGAEDRIDMIRQAADHLQQTAFPGALKISHPRLNHMPGAIELMAFGQVGPTVLRRFDREIGVEITIVTLGCGDQLDHLIGGLLQFRIRLLAQ